MDSHKHTKLMVKQVWYINIIQYLGAGHPESRRPVPLLRSLVQRDISIQSTSIVTGNIVENFKSALFCFRWMEMPLQYIFVRKIPTEGTPPIGLGPSWDNRPWKPTTNKLMNIFLILDLSILRYEKHWLGFANVAISNMMYELKHLACILHS